MIMANGIITQSWPEFDDLNRRRAEFLLDNPDILKKNNLLYRDHIAFPEHIFGIQIDDNEVGFLTSDELKRVIDFNTGVQLYPGE
jgi:hypothetical protein